MTLFNGGQTVVLYIEYWQPKQSLSCTKNCIHIEQEPLSRAVARPSPSTRLFTVYTKIFPEYLLSSKVSALYYTHTKPLTYPR